LLVSWWFADRTTSMLRCDGFEVWVQPNANDIDIRLLGVDGELTGVEYARVLRADEITPPLTLGILAKALRRAITLRASGVPDDERGHIHIRPGETRETAVLALRFSGQDDFQYDIVVPTVRRVAHGSEIERLRLRVSTMEQELAELKRFCLGGEYVLVPNNTGTPWVFTTDTQTFQYQGQIPPGKSWEFLLGFTKLTNLTIQSQTNLTDLSVIGRLVSLKNLSLYNCSQIEDISSLVNLINLEILDLRYTKVVDARPLQNLPKLKQLLKCPTMTNTQMLTQPGLVIQ
jgi:hypothetical protein